MEVKTHNKGSDKYSSNDDVFSNSCARATNKVKNFLSQNIITGKNEILFDMITSLAIHRYNDGCGRCLGFKCIGCWRSFAIVLAHKSEDYHSYLRNVDNIDADLILDGVDKYESYLKG